MSHGSSLAFKTLVSLMVVVLLLPSGFKWMHIFEEHKHEICLGEPQTHIHTLDVDCEFYKYQVNLPFTIPHNTVELAHRTLIVKKRIKVVYDFLSDFQQLHFSLRGPPSLV